MIAADQLGYYEELAAARAGTATTITVTEAIPDWAERYASVAGDLVFAQDLQEVQVPQFPGAGLGQPWTVTLW